MQNQERTDVPGMSRGQVREVLKAARQRAGIATRKRTFTDGRRLGFTQGFAACLKYLAQVAKTQESTESTPRD